MRTIFARTVALSAVLAVLVFSASLARAQEPIYSPPPPPPPPAGVVPPQLDANGYTIFTPSPDTRIVYVSTSIGNDSFSGLTPDRPKRTIAAGKRLLRHTFPDWLLLRRGDTFDEPIGQWVTSGRSENEPQVVWSYGPSTVRPRLRVPRDFAFGRWGGNQAPPRIEHLAVAGLHFTSEGRQANDTPGGILWNGPGDDVLFEDLRIEGFVTNIVLQSPRADPVINIRIRRCVVVDSYSWSTHSNGLYAEGVRGLLIEESLFDRNGWNEFVPGAFPTIFNHNIYIATGNWQVTVRRNILSRASSHAVQLRCGGSVVDNVVVQNPVGILLGGGTPDPLTHTLGVSGSVIGNVVLEGVDILNHPRGIGIDIENIGLRGAVVSGNIIANKITSSDSQSIRLGASGQGVGVGCINVQVTGNVVYNWRGNIRIDDPQPGAVQRAHRFENNIFQEPSPTPFGPLLLVRDNSVMTAVFRSNNSLFLNRPLAQWVVIGQAYMPFDVWANGVSGGIAMIDRVSLTDPTRNLSRYAAAIGGDGTTNGFLLEARRQSRQSFNPGVTAGATLDYLRAGFLAQ
jgi:hypothetical protein